MTTTACRKQLALRWRALSACESTAGPASRVKPQPAGVREAHGLDARCKGFGMLAAAVGNQL